MKVQSQCQAQRIFRIFAWHLQYHPSINNYGSKYNWWESGIESIHCNWIPKLDLPGRDMMFAKILQMWQLPFHFYSTGKTACYYYPSKHCLHHWPCQWVFSWGEIPSENLKFTNHANWFWGSRSVKFFIYHKKHSIARSKFICYNHQQSD